MPRTYKRTPGARGYANYSQEILQAALVAIKRGMSANDASKTFSIPRRTLDYKVKGQHTGKHGAPTSLSEIEERHLVDVIIACSEYGSPLTEFQFRMLVKQHVEKHDLKITRFTNNMPGPDWCQGFLKRHKHRLSQRNCQNIKHVRAEKSEDEMNRYFQNLEGALEKIVPENILNYDETNLSDDPGNQKCIFKRGTKYPERVLNTTKTAISVMFAATATGELLPPYVVYKSDAGRLYDQWCIGGPPNTRYKSTKSGWFDSLAFEDWFVQVVVPWARRKDGKKALIGDNLSSHINVEVLQMCQRYNISFIFLPPNSTHLTQPLDLSFFRPLKRAWREILTSYKVKNPRNSTLNKCSFPKLLNVLMGKIEINKKNIIESGFRAAGIYPLNKNQVLKKLPNNKLDESITENIDGTLLSYLKELRTPSAASSKPRKKMLKTQPGSSVSFEDFDKVPRPSTSKETDLQEFEDLDEESEVSRPSTADVLKESEELAAPRVQEFVLVKFCTKKAIKYYIGQVVQQDQESFCIKYLRKKNDVFIFPEVEDTSWVTMADIEIVFTRYEAGTRDRYVFDIPNQYMLNLN